MLKQGTFINRKYYRLFAGSLPGTLAMGVNAMLDSVLSGNQLGETALTAVSVVAPLTWVIYFFSYLYAPGYGILYGKYNGRFETKKAHEIAGQSVITSLAVGAILALFLLAIKEPFLRCYGCAGEVYTNASAYYNWMVVLAAVMPFSLMLYNLLAADADTLLLSVGGIAVILSNAALSTLLCRSIGVNGLGIGTCFSTIVGIIVYGLHSLRKTNSIRFCFRFHIREFFSAVKLSSSICIAYFFIAAVDIIMNKVILLTSGEGMIAAYSVINLVYCFFEIYSTPFNSAEGLAAAFLGERNNAGIKKLIRTTVRSTVGLGIILAALLLIFAQKLPMLYGMTSPEIVAASVRAARLMALASVPYGIAYVMESVYPSFGKEGLGVLMSVLNDFVCPLAVSVPLAYAFGFGGVAVGMAVNAYFALALFALIAVGKYGRKNFPLYLREYGEDAVSFDLVVTPENTVELRDKVLSEFARRGLRVRMIDLLIEELYTRIREKNPGREILSECTVLFGAERARLIIRDDGELFNFADENNAVDSINAHVLNSLLEKVRDKEYNLTTSFNRNGFVFPYAKDAESSVLPGQNS